MPTQQPGQWCPGTGVHGVILFIKAQHCLKLVVYLKLNKDVGREKQLSPSSPRSSDSSYTFMSNVPPHIPSTNWTYQSSMRSQQLMSCCHHHHWWTTKKICNKESIYNRVSICHRESYFLLHQGLSRLANTFRENGIFAVYNIKASSSEWYLLMEGKGKFVLFNQAFRAHWFSYHRLLDIVTYFL